MSNYIWTWWEQFTYGWEGWMRNLAGPRWENPRCDVNSRRLDTTRVVKSLPMEWPRELRNLNLTVDTPTQVPYLGSVSGFPMQMVDPNNLRTFTVRNPWGGVDVGGTSGVYISKPYTVQIPTPYQNGWAHEGYPNSGVTLDRHWYGIEPDGTSHEAIWMNEPAGSVEAYARYGPNGEVEHRLDTGGYVVKGGMSFTPIVWNRHDPPHRLALLVYNLAKKRSDGDGPSDGTADWEHPAYGDVYRLSHEMWSLFSVGADLEQKVFLDSLYYHGAAVFDRGGDGIHASIAMVAGSQHVGSTIPKLNIPISALELVVA